MDHIIFYKLVKKLDIIVNTILYKRIASLQYVIKTNSTDCSKSHSIECLIRRCYYEL